jgi:poly-gamma-glutamate capsule biosynthesis protein CapA/YwtB (metallophosphatase superfamily)
MSTQAQVTLDALTLLLVGDLILDEPEPDRFFDRVRGVLSAADLVVGHVEVPHTLRGEELDFDVPAPASHPDHLAALGRAGFHVATLAGNHVFDRGPQGIEDTIAALSLAGVQSCGAGRDLAAATQPARLERGGRRIGLLSYNCVGPAAAWAAHDKSGCAYVRLLGDGKGVTLDRHAVADPSSLSAMQRQIERLRSEVELVLVALHKGIVHTPALLAAYERPVARAAIDAGAGIVISHHAHILRGVEVYRGRPIFHGLGNFVTVTRALDPDGAHPRRAAWARQRCERFGFSPDPAYPTYPFHPEARHAMIAACRFEPDGRIGPGFLPCRILGSGQPEILGRDPGGQAVMDYMQAISARAGLSTEFDWDGERIVFA